MQTGENAEGLRKILDMSRMIGLVLLFLHFYFYCHVAFRHWGLTASIGDRLLWNIVKTGLFARPYISKLAALLFLAISLLGSRGRKQEKLTYRSGLICIGVGLLCYFWISFLFRSLTFRTTFSSLWPFRAWAPGGMIDPVIIACCYMGISILVLS
jgi:hypothetical protein